MDIADVRKQADAFAPTLDMVKAQIAPTGWDWYPYGSLSNFLHLDNLLTGANRQLYSDPKAGPVLDIGAADGDTAFFLETLGYDIDVIDYAPTNYNFCQGIEALRTELNARTTVYQRDLDTQFELPRERYQLATVLGLLYHIKNPFYLLERLAQHADRMILSTRVTRFNRGHGAPTGPYNQERVDLKSVPAAYLLDAYETNNDASNYWIFTTAGLERILHRTGWAIEDSMVVGAVDASDPVAPDADERAFVLARSTASAR